MDLSNITVASARKSLDAKEYSSRELTDAYLGEISKKDGEIHAYLEVWEKSARAEADAADAMIARGDSRALTGIPLAIKDNILIEGRRVSAASKILENYVASYDSTVTTKLKSHGAVLLGRTNMDEFAMGSSTENSAYGPTKNPVDTKRIPGGSSGGSAAAVAGGMALAALGSDTGGSIRQPAAHTGIVGLKTTYGSVSRFGLMAMGSSLDQIGPLTKNIEDARIVFDAIRGHDAKDSTSIPDIADGAHLQQRPKVIGVPRKFLESGVDADLLEKFEKTLSDLRAKGYEVRDVEMPTLPYGLAVYYIIMPAEVSTNLARIDGMRYGLSVAADTIGEVYAKSRGIGFGPETRRRILLGTYVLSSGYAESYYRKARAVRSAIRNEFAHAFEYVDAIAVPTTPSPAFEFGAKADPVAMYAEDIFSVPVNLAGVPAISVPMGHVTRDGKDLPVGFQIIAPHRAEETLFAIGNDIENVQK